ncbi:NACHT domain-containing protein [Lactarius quietus]|nr:NACHT domain-containing protein [Lactarius quietus]
MSSSSNPPQTQIADPSSTFKSMLDDALAEYKKKTGDDLQALWLASELQTCESVDAVLDVLREQAKAFERSGDRKLMKWIDPLVHVLYTFSGALGDGIGVPFPPAKVICTGIGVLLGAAKDVRASHGAIIDLFERIESFFKRLEVYKQISLTTEMAEVLVKIVIELLSILSIATKEVRRRRAKLFARKLLGMTDIEDALKRLDSLIQEEFRMATAQILKVAIEIAADVKDGADKTNIAMQQMLNDVEGVKCDVGVVKRDVEEVKWVQIEQDIHKWFSPPDPSTNYNIACKAQYEGTTTWFFQGTKFKHWTSVGSLLWIHGKPGSGKSILCSSIINHAMSLRDAEKASLAYFYFDFRDKDKKQDLRNLITSLLVQLSSCTSPCCEIISRLYSSHGKGAQQPGNGALTKCLREMLLVATEQPIYIIIDALDECPNSDERPDFGMSTPREDVLDLLKSLVRMGLPKLHICVTSRPEIDIKMALERLPHNAVSLHDEIGQKKDISDYVRGIVYSDRMWRLRDEEKRLVIEELTNKAEVPLGNLSA